jgi:hypothetical protein
MRPRRWSWRSRRCDGAGHEGRRATNRGPISTLSIENVERLARARQSGAHPVDLARQYGVSVRTIYRNLERQRFRCRECGRTFALRSQIFAHVVEDIDEDTPAVTPQASVVTPPAPVVPTDWRLARPARPSVADASAGMRLTSAESAILGIVPGSPFVPPEPDWRDRPHKPQLSTAR